MSKNRTAARVAGLKVVKSAAEALESAPEDLNQVEGLTELTEDPAEQPTVAGGRKDGRQPIEVSAPRGFYKGAALVLHFGDSVSQETSASILSAMEASMVAATEEAGLKVAAVSNTYHLTLRIGNEAELAAPIKKASGPREKVLTVDTYPTFRNAVKTRTAELIKAGTFDKANAPQAKRAAREQVMVEWNVADLKTLGEVAANYEASLYGDEAEATE